jgi:hypothetical protein
MTTRQRVLASTAMTAVFLFAEQAAAADGVKLSLGGRYKGTAGVVFDDFSASSGVNDNDVRNYVFKQDVEVYFSGETVLDNGLTVGARIELEGQTSGDQIDSVYAYFSGGFGQVRFGDTFEAYAQLCSLVPSASELFGADSADFNFSNAGIAGYAATNGTCYGVDDNSTKLSISARPSADSALPLRSRPTIRRTRGIRRAAPERGSRTMRARTPRTCHWQPPSIMISTT